MKHPPQNIAASVHQRLLHRAKESKRPFNELLQYFAIERFLYRLSQTQNADNFILKGALMLAVWKAPIQRPTRDIDLLGRIENSVESITLAMKNACNQRVEPDGMIFLADSVECFPITEDADYMGTRVRIKCNLGNAGISVQIDIGFGDVVSPSESDIHYPTILDFPGPVIKGYSRESAIAEKFQAMIKLGILNSRMKDFYDIWLLSRQFDFKGPALTDAILKTFDVRKTEISLQPVPFQEQFTKDPLKEIQWNAFLRKTRIENTPQSFKDIIKTIETFLGPLIIALSGRKSFNMQWRAPGPWKN